MAKTYPLSSAVTGSPRFTYQPGTSKVRRARLEGENIEKLASPTPHLSATRTSGGIKMVQLKTPVGGKL